LPEDEGFGSDFWPYITNNGAEIQVGEVLKGSTARYDKYAKYLNVTAAEYGEVMQEALRYRDFSVGKLLDYRVGVDSSRVVTWVESHDNFANDEMDSVWMTDEDLKLGWAAITARANTTTFMFNRPLGAGGTDYDSRFPGLSQIGDKGSDLFMDDEIVGVNLFRNEMEDESEYLRNLRTNKVLMIERGNRGAVIINVGDSNVSVEDKTNLYDGRYVNRTDEKNVFSIENGIIKGIVPARSVVVIYKSKLEISGEYIDIKGYDEEVENYFTGKGHKVVLLKSDNVNAYYSINGVDKGMYFNGQKVDISDMCEYNGTVEVKLKAEDESGNIEVKTYYFTKKKAINVHRIRLKKNKELKSPVYCYMYSAYGEVSMWPGIEMRDCGDDVYEIIVLKDPFNPPEYVIFNDTSKQVPSKNEYGFKYINNATYSINGDIKPIDN
jgi:alpha-amylase